MPDAPAIPKVSAVRPANEIGQETLSELLDLSAELQELILASIDGLPPIMAAEMARVILTEAEPRLAALLSDAVIEAYITAAMSVVDRLPPSVADPLPRLHPYAIPDGASPVVPPTPPNGIPPNPPALPDDFEPLRERLPVIENAARDLLSRRVVTRATFDQLAADARQATFTVAHLGTAEAVERVRAAVAESVSTGGTQEEFREAVGEALGDSILSEAHLNTVFRTNVMESYSRGLRETVEHPLVSDEFPYVRYVAVHDVRARKEHRQMERQGIGGGPVYRWEDPVIRKFWPPFSYNCRCSAVPISVSEAADLGVREAIAWRDTGRPPLQPTYVAPPPFEPEFAR